MYAIEDALQNGYRVRIEEGQVIGLKGRPLTVKLRGTQRYPTIPMVTPNMPRRFYSVPVHKVVAYAIWGRAAFEDGIQVRHLNASTIDNRGHNLAKGTSSENQYDKPKEVRIRAAKKARAAQGSRPMNAKLNSGSVRQIRFLRRDGMSLQKIADRFGVSKSTAHNVCSRKLYGDVR